MSFLRSREHLSYFAIPDLSSKRQGKPSVALVACGESEFWNYRVRLNKVHEKRGYQEVTTQGSYVVPVFRLASCANKGFSVPHCCDDDMVFTLIS